MLWKHNRTGTIYTILTITNTDADLNRKKEYPTTIVYRNIGGGPIWSQPLETFLSKFTRLTQKRELTTITQQLETVINKL